MRNTSSRDGQQRVTRGFNIEEAPEDSGQEPPRRIRTRAQIMKGEGKRPPAKVELALLAHNPFNPREELTNLEETAESLRAKGQIQPVTVARRAAFLTAHPGQDDALGEAEYVVIDGNRRLASAHLAGLEELRIDVNDDLAASAADILESALIANIHREDVAPLDQAKAIQELVKVHGSQGQVAKRLGKTPAWVSQRLALLELTPDLQEKVETGELKVEPARRIGRLPKEQQAAEAQKTINAVKPPRQRRGKPAETGNDTATVNAVNTLEDSAAAGPDTPATVNAVNTPAGSPAPAALADAEADRSEQGDGGQPKRLPYDDATFIVQHLHRKMTSADFVQGARVWMAVLRDQHPEAYRELLLELSQQEQQPA
ncbi:ParB/RepB/Spo0J family partition protein [Streptomyces sp. NBC_00365]|uniref:ParB/RepB/Spo0J family partition protein n=1 Tax=Streptomyces sp. NBC_00365 TaxID=2975726 RepID=UPI0022560C01|nr:ParB/RepB/Spo0J family partition protein [Streptomyces sp. NBC_00365]MCX5097684.1 ParB/RepB/Spo0J family partition protein [Streptomyces sp. NBC_00365]